VAGINTHGGAGLLQSHGQDGDGVNPDECGQIHNEPLSQSWQVNTTSVTSSDIPSDSVSVAGINMHSGGGLLQSHGHGDDDITLEEHEQIHIEPLSQSRQVKTASVTSSDIPSEDSVSVPGINMRSGGGLLQSHGHGDDDITLEEREQIHIEPLSQSRQVKTASVTSSDIPSEDSVSVAGINMHSGGGLLRLHGHGDHNITLEKHEQIHTEPLSQSWQVNTVLVTLSDIPSEDSVSVAGINMRGGASLLQLHCSDSDVIILEERE